jgi:hypothetical protein
MVHLSIIYPLGMPGLDVNHDLLLHKWMIILRSIKKIIGNMIHNERHEGTTSKEAGSWYL